VITKIAMLSTRAKCILKVNHLKLKINSKFKKKRLLNIISYILNFLIFMVCCICVNLNNINTCKAYREIFLYFLHIFLTLIKSNIKYKIFNILESSDFIIATN